jgi:hypothetical protein
MSSDSTWLLSVSIRISTVNSKNGVMSIRKRFTDVPTHNFQLPTWREKIWQRELKYKVRIFYFSGSRWKVRELTYKITKYPTGLDKTDVDGEIYEAFKVWERETNLTFRRVPSGKVHIEIQFQKGEHGDGWVIQKSVVGIRVAAIIKRTKKDDD